MKMAKNDKPVLSVIGDFSGAMIFAERADGRFARIDHGIDLSERFTVKSHNPAGEEAVFRFLGTPAEARALIPDPSKGDIAVYQPADTTGKKVILRGSGQIQISDREPAFDQ